MTFVNTEEVVKASLERLADAHKPALRPSPEIIERADETLHDFFCAAYPTSIGQLN